MRAPYRAHIPTYVIERYAYTTHARAVSVCSMDVRTHTYLTVCIHIHGHRQDAFLHHTQKKREHLTIRLRQSAPHGHGSFWSSRFRSPKLHVHHKPALNPCASHTPYPCPLPRLSCTTKALAPTPVPRHAPLAHRRSAQFIIALSAER